MLPRSPNQRLILVLTLALVIRLLGIAARPIWYDEAFSLLLAEQGPTAILSGTLSTDSDASAAEEHPPAYYFMLWGWIQAFGDSVIASRALSILAGMGIVAFVYLIAKHSIDETIALIATVFASILPFQVHYAQEIRMYVFLALWLTLAIHAYQRKQWIVFSLSAALAQYTHTLAAIYLIPLAVTPIFQKDWKTLRAVTLAGLAAILIYFPWLIQLPSQLSKVDSAYWLQRPGLEKLFTLILVYLPNLPLPAGWLFPALLFSALIIAIAAFQTYRAVKQKLAGSNLGLWFAYLAFVPPLLLWLVSQVVPVFIERALLPAHVMFCIWLAWALTRAQMPRAIRMTAFAVIFALGILGIYQHVTYRGFPYGPFADLDKTLSQRIEAGDVVVHSNKLSYLPSVYFDRGLSQTFIADPVGSEVDTLSPGTMQILNLNVAQDIESATTDASRVWFIIYEQSIEEMTNQGQDSHPQLIYLNKNFDLESVEKWDDLRLYLFTRRKP